MYHAIVRRRVVGLFAAVSNGNARPVLEGLAPRFEHFFLGDHALGGSRFTLEKTRLWYERGKMHPRRRAQNLIRKIFAVFQTNFWRTPLR